MAFLFNIQKYNVYDGPGIRTLVFFKGCPLHCRWCSNPEGQSFRYDIFLKRDRCIGCGKCVDVCLSRIHRISEKKLHEINRELVCTGCRRCSEVCPAQALEIVGNDMTVQEIMKIICEDRAFYETTGGGVTLGGGEFSFQFGEALELLDACRKEGIHTAVETCGFMSSVQIRQLASLVDLFLYDIKLIDEKEHQKWTGTSNEKILENLTWLLQSGCSVRVRIPLIHGVNDSEGSIEQIIQYLMPFKNEISLEGIELLPYHKMGVQKYVQLDRAYMFGDEACVPETELIRIESQFERKGIRAKLLKH